LLNFGKGQMVPSADLISGLITIVAEDAVALNCTAEIECLHDIIEGGTSAHWQRAIYKQSLERGKSKQDALNDVVDMLIKETVSGI
jgi:carboxylate-amine ligase